MSMNEYVTKFNQLSRYALHKIDTDEKKQECLLNGLNDGLAYPLEARDFENFQGMVNKALVLENRRGVMERKRKVVRQHQLSSSSKPRVVRSSTGPVFHPSQLQFLQGRRQLDKDSLPRSIR
jgi:TPP-dependent indolepyruvate ferredoxin oxidoreductase alpha subunit